MLTTPLKRAALGCSLLALIVLAISALQGPEIVSGPSLLRPASNPSHNGKSSSSPASAFIDLATSIYRPLILAPNAPSFTRPDGSEYKLPSEPIWNTTLPSDILIVDIDTRPLNSTNQLLGANNSTLDWELFDLPSSGILNHYLYARLHNYTYKFIHIDPSANNSTLAPSWAKPSIIQQLLFTHRFVVFLDADAIFTHLHVPLEWLLNYWSITPRTSISMPLDPSLPRNMDPYGRLMQNTGFIIAQNSSRTQDMLTKWGRCTTNEHYAGCSKWKQQWAHEQAAFAEFVRYEFTEEEDVKELACQEANGYPWAEGGCEGVFVRHFWIEKTRLREGVAESVMGGVVGGLKEAFQQEKEVVLTTMVPEL